NDDGTARSWVIMPDGTYTVEGVKRGRVKFGVLSPDPARANSILNTKGKKKAAAAKGTLGEDPAAAGWFPLPRELGDPAKSGLECEVASSRVRHDLDLK